MRRDGAGLRTRGLLTALALVASLLTSVVAASSASASDSGTMVANINAARRSAGLSALSSNSALSSVAQSWAARMAASGTLAHNPGLRSQVSGWRALGENVGVGGSVSSLHAAFMGSSPHRANILSRQYTQVGVGVASGRGQIWVVEVFRLPSGASAPVKSTPTRPTTKPRTTTRPKATTRPKTTTKPKTTTSRPVTKPVSRTTTRAATVTKVAAKAAPKTPLSRSVPAVPVVEQSQLTLDAVLTHVRLAMTGSGDPVAAWAWLLRRLIGLRTTIGA